jgi:ferredoxin
VPVADDVHELLTELNVDEDEAVIAPVAGVNDRPETGWVAIVKDEEKCIRCGLCAKRCPVGVITMESFFRAAS